jgi:hypothetical protein
MGGDDPDAGAIPDDQERSMLLPAEQQGNLSARGRGVETGAGIQHFDDDDLAFLAAARHAATVADRPHQPMKAAVIAWHWVTCPACRNFVLMRRGDPHATETLRAECQGPRHHD